MRKSIFFLLLFSLTALSFSFGLTVSAAGTKDFGDLCLPGECIAAAYCNTDGVPQVCDPKKISGEACPLGDLECTTGKCLASGTCGCQTHSDCLSAQFCHLSSILGLVNPTNECKPKLAEGVDCFINEMCTSNTCTDKKCAAAPAGTGTGDATAAPDENYDIPNFLGTEDPNEVIGRVVKYIMGFVGTIALVTFMYGGILWLISGGREAYVDKGRDTMVWSAIGMVVVFSSYILIDFVFKLLGQQPYKKLNKKSMKNKSFFSFIIISAFLLIAFIPTKNALALATVNVNGSSFCCNSNYGSCAAVVDSSMSPTEALAATNQCLADADCVSAGSCTGQPDPLPEKCSILRLDKCNNLSDCNSANAVWANTTCLTAADCSALPVSSGNISPTPYDGGCWPMPKCSGSITEECVLFNLNSATPTSTSCTDAGGSLMTSTWNSVYLCLKLEAEDITCTDWTYSPWTACTNDTKTRTILTSIPADCSGGSPEAVSQACTSGPPACTAWDYSAWTTCTATGTQTRTATPTTPAGCSGGSPEAVSQACTLPTGKAIGETCAAGECVNTAFCIPIVNKCAAKLPGGSPCDPTNPASATLCLSGSCVIKAGQTTPTVGECAAPTAGTDTGTGSGDATVAPATKYNLPNFLGTDDPNEVIGRVVKYIMGFVGTIALLTFMYGGILWLISAGREAYVDKGRDTMVWSAVGLVVVFSSYILIDFVFKLLGQ